MNGLGFVASVVASLAWPVTVLITVVLLREPLSRLLTRTSKVKYKELEVDFEQELQQLEAKAQAIALKPKIEVATPEKAVTETTLLGQADQLSSELPQVSVALAWSAVEDSLLRAVMRLGVSPDYPPHNSAAKNAVLLQDQGLIDAQTVELLKSMRSLRNAAVHSAGTQAISSQQAMEFLGLAGGLVEKIDGL